MSAVRLFLFIFFYHNSVWSTYFKGDAPSERFFHDELIKNQLDNVKLNHRNIPRITKDLLWELTMVEKLEIENSNVRTIEPFSFQRMENLKKLSLKHNLVEEIKVNVFCLPQTEELDLSDNQIKTIEGYAFFYMWKLKSINLRNNKLETYNNEWFLGNPNLCSINLENNFIKALPEHVFTPPPFHFTRCPINFVVSHNRIEEVSEDAFTYKWGFNKLYLDHNAIATIKNKTFSQTSVVKDLRLNNNQLVCTTADLKFVQKINVENNPWNQQCLQTFLEQKNIEPSTTLKPTITTTRTRYLRFG